MTRACVLFARAPSSPGKTRLTANLTDDGALALRRALLLDTYEAVCATGVDVVVAFTPDHARDEMQALLVGAGTTFRPQRGDDLGERMHNALADAGAAAARQVLLVGSDLPSLPPSHLSDAFTALASHDVVFGPSEDGGYYLVGVNAHAVAAATSLFQEIAWGSEAVLAQTLSAAEAVGLRTTLIPRAFDIDTREDLLRLHHDPRPDAARHTRAWLAHHPLSE
jgi:rSAM/selenodomain-associated transferase 1